MLVGVQQARKEKLQKPENALLMGRALLSFKGLAPLKLGASTPDH